METVKVAATIFNTGFSGVLILISNMNITIGSLDEERIRIVNKRN